MIFFYEMLFVAVSLGAIVIGERWSRGAAVLFLAIWWGVIALGYLSFGARLSVEGEPLAEDDRRWLTDARDGLRHLRLLFGIATAAALLWWLIAG